MSRHYGNDSDDDDTTRSPSKKCVSEASKSINEILQRALEEAANPGIGDEEPEVMKTEQELQKESERMAIENDPEVKEEIRRHEERMRRNAAIEEEERRVAELNFDHNALLPTATMRERAKYIPLRLTYDERKSLRLVNAAINVSDYTTVIDVVFKSKAKRHHAQLQHIVAFLTGLVAATDYTKGQEVLADRNFSVFEELLKCMLEIARRYKVTNPEKMRSEYGKLVYLIQDAVSTEIKPLLGVDVHRSIHTVHDCLTTCAGLAMLDDPNIATATEEILPCKSKSKSVIQLEIRRKEKAVESLVRTHMSHRLPADTIRHCLYSISDNNSFLNSNKKPVSDCIELLHKYFSPGAVTAEYFLGIQEGQAGARLSHSHEQQFHYVHQSLALWEAILEDMFRLWYLGEQDLLCESISYDLRNTGQGLQRVQQSPKVYRAMHEILARTQQKLGSWVGSSVIHLGDHNVPNTLVFIDKYTQVARILGPLVKTLTNLETCCEENEGLSRYIRAYGGMDKARKDILLDFFKFGFDGSGGDNFFDAGSCIDGRLTSAWNWCSQLPTKPYYPLFRLTGFSSFDGQFDK